MSETFKRKEKKYLLDLGQYEQLLGKIRPYVNKNKFFQTDIYSLYYDTDDNKLIRRSIEKPFFKEKLRLRGYGNVDLNDMVYIELKKKYDGVVYKRRTKTRHVDALNQIGICKYEDEQIGKEIKYFIEYYHGLHPSYFIGCNRTSYNAKEDEKFRITFDKDIVYRNSRLFLGRDEQDKELTDKIVMELKGDKSMPLWLSHILDDLKIYPSSFSKVGTAYLKELNLKLEER